MQILITGFEPFGGSTINPSEQAARALDGQVISGLRVVTAILPVDWQRGPQTLLDAVQSHRPDAVLCLGEAAGRSCLSIERAALNLLDFRIPDNSGVTLIDQPVVAGGPAAYFVTLPVREVFEAVQAAGVPVELSLSAGAYLCNQVLYRLLHSLDEASLSIPAGFIHLPCLPQQVASLHQRQPSMSLDTLLTGIRAAVERIALVCEKTRA